MVEHNPRPLIRMLPKTTFAPRLNLHDQLDTILIRDNIIRGVGMTVAEVECQPKRLNITAGEFIPQHHPILNFGLCLFWTLKFDF